MADDLMDFSEAEMKEASLVLEEDENDIPKAPGLVQSPVIVNSILKQSTKDNLIQLYTPVQKPEKGRLKVHFGRDSLLQTPNVNQAKKKREGGTAVKEEAEVKKNGVKFAREGKENVPVEPHTTDVTAKSDSDASGGDVAQHSVDEVTHQTAVTDEADKSCVDNALDYSAMEVSICETETFEKTVDPVDDIILQAEMLLRSLQGATKSQAEVSEIIQVADGTAFKDSPKETGENNVTETAAAKTEIGTLNIDQESEAGIANITEEEPMECEEAMVVDEEDDEIVFNLDRNKKHETTEENEVKVEKTEEVKISVETVGEVSKECDAEKIESDFHKRDDSPNLKNDENKTVQDSSNNIESGAKDKIISEEEEKENNEECLTESVDNSQIKDIAASNVQKTSTDVESGLTEVNSNKGEYSKKTGGDSSDEEFLSADEDMEDVEVKTPAKDSDIGSDNQQVINTEPKQDSPERTPPKVGYNLNFDDLDSVDPFATKKGLVNSPDVGKLPKQQVKTDEDEKEKEGKLSVGSSDLATEKVNDTGGKSEVYKSANTTPEKSAAQNSKIILSPNAALVDEVCRNKTVGDIFEEKPDCLLSADVEQEDHVESLQKVECNLNTAESGAKREIDFDNIDPFKPTVQIVNTPDKSKQEGAKQINTEEPLKTSEQKVNTPDKSEVKDKCEDSQTEATKIVETAENIDSQKYVVEQSKTETDMPVTPEKQVAENRQIEPSPQIPVTKGTYNLDALDLDDVDPFKPTKQMTNSPSSNSVANATDEKVDPFKPKMQIQISPISQKNSESKPEESDPLKPKKQIMNSMVSEKGIVEVTEKNVNAERHEDVEDPFKPRSQIKNSPTKTSEDIPAEEDDPFKPKSKIQNSPSVKVSSGSVDAPNLESLENIDPFKPKSQIQQSPAGKVADTINNLESENFDDIDPFKSKSQLMNSPVDKVKQVEPNLDAIENPFQPRNQMQNSPQVKESKSEAKVTEDSDNKISSTEHRPDEGIDVDPFKSTKQLKMSPPPKTEPKVDPFADLNPFETKSKVAKTPEKAEQQGLGDFDDIDPFKSNSKIPNSPDLKTTEEGDPFVTKSRIANTPTKEVEQFTTPVNESEEEADLLGEVFEVQGVTRRGQDSQQNQLADIDETQFVPASQVFNDPAAWEMLEKLESASANTAESALSRMSLYVKFDPLVDAPAVNSRRISIKVSQLEKVKEYGLEETLLLLGTPPKKRRQSMTAAQARITPGGSKTLSAAAAPTADKKAESVAVGPEAVDLILAYSPSEKEQAQTFDMISNAPDLAEESDDLVQELKYTDADMKRFQRDNKLAMQGMLINKDKEWSEKEKQWEKKNAELAKKLEQIIQDRDKLEQAFLGLEQTSYEIAAARDASRKEVEVLKNEKEQALQDIQELERSFSDLHRRYEKTKSLVMSMKKNEETLKTFANECLEKNKKMNEKYHMLEKSSQEKLAVNKLEMEKLTQQRDSIQSKFDAQVKIMQMKIENMETSLQRKTEENKQLTEICDNLLNKVGQ